MSGSYQYSVLVRTGTDEVVSDADDVRRLVMFFAVSRAHKLVIDPTLIFDRDDFLDERPVVHSSDQFRPGSACHPRSAVIEVNWWACPLGSRKEHYDRGTISATPVLSTSF